MRIRYDPEVDALSVTFRDTTVTTRDLADGIIGDPSTLREVTLEGVGLTAPTSSATVPRPSHPVPS